MKTQEQIEKERNRKRLERERSFFAKSALKKYHEFFESVQEEIAYELRKAFIEQTLTEEEKTAIGWVLNREFRQSENGIKTTKAITQAE